MGTKAYRDANKAELAAKQRAYYRANKAKRDEASREYYETNKEACKEGMKSYRENNLAATNAHKAKYRAAKLERTPSWADDEAISFVYHAAQAIKDVYGGKPHVDHIVPLQGKKVSGLHVASNLQLISATDNLRKGNR